MFWDIENLPVPSRKSAFAVATKVRRVFLEGKREAEFMCVCDVTKMRKKVTDDLHRAQVYRGGHIYTCARACIHVQYIHTLVINS